MLTSGSIDEIRGWSRSRHQAGEPVGFVPTMGALHEGHLALIRRARQMTDAVAVSIFVNPTQFSPGEDLGAYPRPHESDLESCRAEGVDAVLMPTAETVYPEGHVTSISSGRLGQMLEGESRLGHFDGVCTVVAKLFNIVEPDVAVFGWKDAQQFLILRRMVADLNMAVHLEAVETVREDDGLALSSRNAYLTREEREQAPQIQRALQAALSRVIAGCRKTEPLRKAILETLGEAQLLHLDRLDIVHMDTLEPLERVASGKTLIAIAAHLGRARLIDNVRC
jgi:pantoate--beta-alanine ligase